MHEATLTGVAVVCRARPDIDAVDAVIRLIDAFADPSPLWTLVSASAKAHAGLLRLLMRIAENDPVDIDPLLKHQIFSRALIHVVAHGDIDAVRWLVEQYLPTGKLREPVFHAVVYNQLEILQWMSAHHGPRMVWMHKELRVGADLHHLATAKWLFEDSGQFDDDGPTNLSLLFDRAASKGDLEMVEWVNDQYVQRGIPFRPDHGQAALFLAAKNGNRGVMEFVSERYGCSYDEACLNGAIIGGRLEIAQWLRERTGIHRIEARSLMTPALCGQAEFIEWSLDNFELDDAAELRQVIDMAAGSGCLSIVKLLGRLFKSGTVANSMNQVADGAHLDDTPLVHENRNEHMSMDNAASSGHLDVVKWLDENLNAVCSEVAMRGAAEHNHLDVVKWLDEKHPESRTVDAMHAAALNGHIEVVKWLYERGIGDSSIGAVHNAAANGHLEVVRWLHEQGLDDNTGIAMDNAASNGHLEVVRWFHEHGHECCTDAMDWTAGNGHLDMVKWLHANRTEGCSSMAFYAAAWGGHAHVFSWLLANKSDQLKVDDELIMGAVAGGELAIVLDINKRTPGGLKPSFDMFREALQRKRYEIFEWLAVNYRGSAEVLKEWMRDGLRSDTFDAYARDIVQGLVDD